MTKCKNDAKTVEDMEITAIMVTDRGRNFVRRILEMTGYFASTFDENNAKQSFKNGRRSVGLDLIDQLKEICPGELSTMLKEHFNDW